MKIIGIKYLNRNNYKKIRIGHNEILVTGKLDGDESLLTDKKNFTDTLKGLDHKHIIDGVIEYFLDSHTINGVSNNNFSKNTIKVFGDDDVSLKICIPVDKEVAGRVMSKYRHDRFSFIENMDLLGCNISILVVDGNSSYKRNEDNSYTFCLSSKADNIRKFEKEFLLGFIGQMLSDREVMMTREDDLDEIGFSKISFLEENIESAQKYTWYGAPCIKIKNSMIPMIESIVVGHNEKCNSCIIAKNKILVKNGGI